MEKSLKNTAKMFFFTFSLFFREKNINLFSVQDLQKIYKYQRKFNFFDLMWYSEPEDPDTDPKLLGNCWFWIRRFIYLE
jgi:hypothetical protein